MSIRKVQTERVLEDVAHSLYATGISPTLNQVLSMVSGYFSQYPAGTPLPLYLDFIRSKQVSDVERFNLMLAHLTMNIDVLYDVCLDQVEEILLLTAALQTDLEKLKVRRNRVETLIDDYLLSLYNTDGYYYSVSDIFGDTTMTDLSLTSAFVDVSTGAVMLPTISTLSRKVPANNIGDPSISVMVNNNAASYTTISPFSYALDGNSNTVWEIQVDTDAPAEVVVTLTIPILTPSTVSKIDYDPYVITPVQVFMTAGVTDNTGNTSYHSFGSSISTGTTKFSFMDQAQSMEAIRFTLRKTKYDFTNNNNGAVRYRYVFGAKDITLTEQVYDSEAIFVSTPLTLPTELQQDMVIDAVSLVADQDVLADTGITFYIAEDSTVMNPTLGDFNWKQIEPIGHGSNNVIHFEGAQAITTYIRDDPTTGELQLINPDTTNVDLTKRNPSPIIMPGVDIYRLATFTDGYIQNAIQLDEGVNSTRVLYLPYNVEAVNSLDYWASYVKDPSLATVTYGRIDTGKGFFYGGDVGENGVSVYVETYLDSPEDHELILANLRKSDLNSQTWSIRAYLNGRQIAWLPGRNTDTSPAVTGPAQDIMLVPWAFRRGLNHISMLINIPSTSKTDVNNPYIGVVDLMAGKTVEDYGTVKLATWSYVDFFDMQHNQTGDPNSFTILNDEIISRKRPSANFRLQYMKSTSQGPDAVRLRADLSRSVNNMNVSPKLNSYRVRFSYGATHA